MGRADGCGEIAMKSLTTLDKHASALLAAAFEALPKRIVCPRCKKSKAKEAFGLRVMTRDDRGVPTRIAKQSYCKRCRG
jgi:hypothetical protein